MSNPQDLYNTIVGLLESSGVPYTIHEHAPSITIQDADANLWFPVERLVKTIAFRIRGGGYVLAALCGYSQVDYKKLAAAVGGEQAGSMMLFGLGKIYAQLAERDETPQAVRKSLTKRLDHDDPGAFATHVAVGAIIEGKTLATR